jgi:hypothetical protein
MWTAEVVMARFVEAADVERRMLVKGMSAGGNAWPTYGFDDEDRKGWVQEDIDDEKERWSRNKVTTTPEITRWEEVYFDWTALVRQDHRLLIWRWAQCIAGNRSFSAWCERKGIVRMTAYKRRDRVVRTLAEQFRLEARLLRWPEGKWSLQDEANLAPVAHTMETAASKAAPVEHLPFRTERHHDTLTTPAAVAAFAQHLADTNARRRKSQERRRIKSLRGAPGEDQEAA